MNRAQPDKDDARVAMQPDHARLLASPSLQTTDLVSA